ncbi:formate dehydrogenase accessory sulfurtransferase FdhD [Pseudooceanicola sp.]|uniref:formate dehydrogenase accessory sulfurtransferase FdhD n=1 Tax=Pseudooceanicola sp. TaxID=1914328 RepID=UPI002639965C|nr:formate dehydrogenase accessory sulfurtransferase FdhD [Pseudooceanicola sp.]MDF1856883.1 formate dehydrogenase accessory sulfurtransferase FdhD [Pseudooceanicola sp.]
MKGIASQSVATMSGGAIGTATRSLPEEVPVALVAQGSTLAVMMCSPGDLEDFALGFCLSEAIVSDPGQIETLEIVELEQGIEARLWLAPDRAGALSARRRFMAGPVGCGMCGIDSLEQAMRPLPEVAAGPLFGSDEVTGAAEALRRFQPLHDRARGLHAAGFLRPGQGPGAGIAAAREDVGRHNALDKLIGGMARAGADMKSGAVVLTSRVSVEMVQKCALAGVPLIVAVSAPTSLALKLAQAAGITLVTMSGPAAIDVWCRPERITGGADDI